MTNIVPGACLFTSNNTVDKLGTDTTSELSLSHQLSNGVGCYFILKYYFNSLENVHRLDLKAFYSKFQGRNQLGRIEIRTRIAGLESRTLKSELCGHPSPHSSTY